jgi:hypothetical protein
MIKALKELGIERMFLNITKAIYDKPRANIILNGELKLLLLKVRNETGLSTFSIPIQYSFGIPNQDNENSYRQFIQMDIIYL